MTPAWRLPLVGLLLAGGLTACQAEPVAAPPSPAASPASPGTARPSTPPEPPSPSPSTRPPLGTVPPPWLGTRVLPETADGFGEVRPTPRVMRNRRWNTPDTI